MTSLCPHPPAFEYPAPGPLLRSFPRNSAEAAARIVALALIANGHIKAVETVALGARRDHERLGLTQRQWHGVIHDLCADLFGPARCGEEICISGELQDLGLTALGEARSRHRVPHGCHESVTVAG